MAGNSAELMTNGTMDPAGEDEAKRPEISSFVQSKSTVVAEERPSSPEIVTESNETAGGLVPKLAEAVQKEEAAEDQPEIWSTEESNATRRELIQAEKTVEDGRENSELSKTDAKTLEVNKPEVSRAKDGVLENVEDFSTSAEAGYESSSIEAKQEDNAADDSKPEKDENLEKRDEETKLDTIEDIINEEEKTLNDILKIADENSTEAERKKEENDLEVEQGSRDVSEDSTVPDSDEFKSSIRLNLLKILKTSNDESISRQDEAKTAERETNNETPPELNDDNLDLCSNAETKDSDISGEVKVNKAPSPVSVSEEKLENVGKEEGDIGNNDDDNEKSEVGIVGPPTAVSELINEEELRTESALPMERGDNVQDHVAEWVQSAAAKGESQGRRETNVEEKSRKGKKGGDNTVAVPTRKSQRIVSNIIKRSIKCLNKMHAMDAGTGNGKGEKTTRVGGGSPNIPQSQQNGAALPEETAAAASQQAHPVKKEPTSDVEIDPDILAEIQLRTETARNAAKTADTAQVRKRRSTDDVQHSNGNPKRACIEQREEFISALVGSDKISAQELSIRAEELRAELQALDQLARAKEKEWNEILSMRKLKEEAYLRIERRRQVVGFMEGNGPLGDAVLAPTNLSVSQDWEGAKERSRSAPESLQKERNTRPQQTISSSRQVENGQKETDIQNSENRQIGEGRQGPIVDVKSIIADYRLRHPETVPRRGRRGRKIRNSVNVDLGAGGAVVETGITGDSRPSSTDSCKSNPNTSADPSSSMSFKDVLVQFAKLSQQQGEPVKTPQNYPDVTLHPVAPPAVAQTVAPQQTGSLLHGILTKSQSPRPTTFSPTLARLLTAPERDRSSPVATSTPQQNLTTQHLLQTYQGSNPVSISDLLSSSKARTEITITPVVNAPVQSHSNNLIHVEEVEEEATVIEERGGRSMSSARDDRDSPPRCQGCHDRAAQFVCAGCGNQWYCSRECQVSAWDEHSEVCSG